ncbi:MAG: hypothetical protein IPL61_27145 [Myxococcales bacterium]|nr:hypothetical protein [Myxococcales bacterium]
MSSPLSAARVLSVDGATAHIRLEPQQALTLPYSDAFALALAYEPLASIVYYQPGRPWPHAITGPLQAAVRGELGGTDRTVNDAFTGGCDRDALLTIARRYVTCVGYRDPVGALVPVDVQPDRAGQFVPRSPPTAAAVTRAVVRAFDQHWITPVGPAPAVTIILAATDPRWLRHLVPDMRWDSYVFDDDAPMYP